MISLLLLPCISLFSFFRYFRLSWKWSCCFLYLFLNAGLFFMELRLPLPQGLWLLPEACLLALAGSPAFRRPFGELLPYSVLSASALSVCQGCAQCVIFWFATKLPPDTVVLKYLDALQSLLAALLFSLLLLFISRAFPPSVPGESYGTRLLLLIPIFFISLTERTISGSVYGSVTIWDQKLGLIYPVVEHGEIFLLQLLAGVCLFALLFAWKKLTKAVLLEQQLHVQELYIKEICSRYEKTRSFRHDIKNHLTVLEKLLEEQEFQEAGAYLSHLEQAADTLSYPVHTGIRAADAVLGSKLALAVEHQIAPQWELTLPNTDRIPDMDWCILLFNALDNAIHANLQLPPHLRRLYIHGSQKGNLYLLSVENACPDTGGRLPTEGTGLSNIRSTAGKHGGTVGITVSKNSFRLEILLIIS